MATLFTIEAGPVRLTWSAPREAVPPVTPQEPAAPPYGLTVEVLRAAWTPTVQTPTVEKSASPGYLFEQTPYTLFARSRDGRPLALRHRDPVLVRALQPAEGEADILHGTLNFGSQVGTSRFVLEHDGRPCLAFQVEVVPSKLDYRSDYAALLADAEAVAASLALAYLRSTEAAGTDVPANDDDTLTWALVLRHIAGDLERALRFVRQHPLWDLERAAVPTPARQVRRVDAAVRRALRQRPRTAEPLVPERRARYTLDTPEHRWLAHQLRTARQRLAALRRRETALPATARRARVLAELDALHALLHRLLTQPPLADAGSTPPAEPSLRLLQAPGYRTAYEACRLLRRGLTVRGGPLALGMKDLHLLYEYWCFLTLVRLLADLAEQPLPVADLLAVERDGLRVRLRRGRPQTVRLPLLDGRRVEVVYNPRYAGRQTLVPQQPDLVLTVHTPDGPRRHVLDAKYRLDASPAYRRRYGLPGPPTDALNDLHRYRDAVREADLRRAVVQAVALYPYREETPGAYAASRLAQRLPELGVGAIPLLPGATEHLRAWLRSVLDG